MGEGGKVYSDLTYPCRFGCVVMIVTSLTLFSFIGLDVWGQGLHSDLFPRGSCVQEDLALLLAGGRGSHHQPQHAANRGGLDGRIQRLLL